MELKKIKRLKNIIYTLFSVIAIFSFYKIHAMNKSIEKANHPTGSEFTVVHKDITKDDANYAVLVDEFLTPENLKSVAENIVKDENRDKKITIRMYSDKDLIKKEKVIATVTYTKKDGYQITDYDEGEDK
ncbi:MULTISPECIES: hypothetical protein [Bacillus]|uniref:Uncharacterized protein n=3 Tax=Bacillus TaxID=1386 RepID=A0AAP4V3Q2_BACTU|nr:MULTISPECIES: hypothetical protein [Bacillus]MEC0046468.1 hypothetical protein [Bacillus cereus]AFV21834.1 hypothetical protein BTB_502p05290 [Bacillus thuringiensis Bt407]ERI00989.1 hypothetical protein BTCBT_002544 [Bacillus thuringiensis T01-328]MDN7078421.1 hypothetical protein [Bacillus thuringiensis]MDQ7259842.1 hypothetical protein [Bacillus thuringiensis]